MTKDGPDDIDRTLKLELDSGRAGSRAEAEAIVRRYVLQIDVGPGMETSRARQAALLTALNTARRAFIGGVQVRTQDNPALNTPWARAMRLREAITAYGGRLVDSLTSDATTLVIGDPPILPKDAVVLHPTFNGWTGGVVRDVERRLPEAADFPLSGVLAGAMAVSEAFQAVRGDLVAARRDIGLSLWRPDIDWRSPEAVGGSWSFLPSRIWLLGLGHLGQAFAWTVGLLPYADPREVLIMVQDFDVVVSANAATGLLVPSDFTSEPKTRLVSRQLESLGIRTRISEREFSSSTPRQPSEPGVALAGFDKPEPRRALDRGNFDQAVDLGLGGGPTHYLDILMHSFPSGLSSEKAFPASVGTIDADILQLPAYRDWAERLAQSGDFSEEQIKCGLLEVAGRTVGASFVGAVAASLGVAETIRSLVDGPRYEVLGFTLRSPAYVDAAPNTNPGPARNPGFARAL